jgi:predicted ATPase
MATVPQEETVKEVDNSTRAPFLRRVRIRGYKSIAFCEVQLQPLTILVGRNAAGKSNFLDALAFLRDVMKVGVAEAVNIRPRGGWSSLVCRLADSPNIQIEVETEFTCGQHASDIGAERSLSEKLLPTGEEPIADVIGKAFLATYSLEFFNGPHSAPTISKERLEIVDEDKQTEGYEIRGGRALWFQSPRSLNSQWVPPPAELLSVQRPDFPLLSVLGKQPFVELGDALRWMTFYNFIPDAMRVLPFPTIGSLLDKHGQNLASVIENLKELEPESVQRVRDYLSAIAQEIENFDVVHHGEYETVRFRVRGAVSDKQLEFDAASMSDGTLRALGALMAAFQISLPHGFPTLVGIEEPETALHPAAMRALVDALDDATQRTQVLLTTHSADLLSGRDVNPSQVLVVRNRGGRTHIAPVDPASREIIQKELYSLAELQRMDKLDLDEADLVRQVEISRQEGT